MLIAIISVMLYHYIKVTTFEVVVQRLTNEAAAYVADPLKFNPHNLSTFSINPPDAIQSDVTIVAHPLPRKTPYFMHDDNGDETFLHLYYPLDENSYLKFSKNTTFYSEIVRQILIDIIIVNATAIALVLFYALFYRGCCCAAKFAPPQS